MRILAINTKKKFIGNAPLDAYKYNHIPNKGDSILFGSKKYKVISRYFQYRDDELEIVNVYVRQLRWYDYFNCL